MLIALSLEAAVTTGLRPATGRFAGGAGGVGLAFAATREGPFASCWEKGSEAAALGTIAGGGGGGGGGGAATATNSSR
jgi:hypothetical protein